jgi:hypothetical protein
MVLAFGLREMDSQAIVLRVMAISIHLEVEVPGDLARFRLPGGVQQRLQELLDRQDAGNALTAQEKREAKGLVELADLLSLLRLRAERIG